jgi:hypothetical protein
MNRIKIKIGINQIVFIVGFNRSFRFIITKASPTHLGYVGDDKLFILLQRILSQFLDFAWPQDGS